MKKSGRAHEITNINLADAQRALLTATMIAVQAYGVQQRSLEYIEVSKQKLNCSRRDLYGTLVREVGNNDV